MVQHIGHSRRRSEPNSPELIAQIEALQAERISNRYDKCCFRYG